MDRRGALVKATDLLDVLEVLHEVGMLGYTRAAAQGGEVDLYVALLGGRRAIVSVQHGLPLRDADPPARVTLRVDGLAAHTVDADAAGLTWLRARLRELDASP